MVAWVFFDLGGTLLDEGPEHEFLYRTLADLLADHGVHASAAELRARARTLIRDHVAGLVRVLIEERLRDPRAAEDVRHELSRRHRERAGELQPPYPGARSVLDDLGRDYHLGILANQPATMRPYLDAIGLGARVDAVLLSGEVGLAKPDPAFFRLALEVAMCPSPEIAMVGDRIDNDIAPAKSLSMRTVRVRSPEYATAEPHHAGERPDLEIRRIDEAPAAIRRL